MTCPVRYVGRVGISMFGIGMIEISMLGIGIVEIGMVSMLVGFVSLVLVVVWLVRVRFRVIADGYRVDYISCRWV